MSWYWGSQETFTVARSARSSVTIRVRLCARLEWEIITPLGSEVDPDVYCRNANVLSDPDPAPDPAPAAAPGVEVVGAGTGAGAGAGPLLPFRSTSSTATHRSSGHLRPPPLNNPFKPSTFLAKLYVLLVRAVAAPQLDWMFTKCVRSFLSLRGSGGNTGTATRPALKQASRVRVKSNPGKKTNKTLSPGLSLWVLRSTSARAEEAAASSL
mmetsp:Transcript_27651/g.61953  ORF Transcript_27651/g.61953 Transcript_27651/m.61953 type:complete len:211 (+) Transcript_27651:410-1042(+)